VFTDRLTEWQNDRSDFIICPMLCYSNGRDNYTTVVYVSKRLKVPTCKHAVSQHHTVLQCTPHRTCANKSVSSAASRHRSRSYRPETGRRFLPSASCGQTLRQRTFGTRAGAPRTSTVIRRLTGYNENTKDMFNAYTTKAYILHLKLNIIK